MDWKDVFEQLLHAEDEGEVTGILAEYGLLREDDLWVPLGGEENNFAIVGNQQTEATGALVEKIINGIDAQLLLACYQAGIDPEGNGAPVSMAEAVERFFGIKGGRLGDLTSSEQTRHAEKIRLVAVGANREPSYLVIDTGEGQTPKSFPTTFMSLAKSNKLRIPFVQGKYNAGGTGVLQFCGTQNYQLVASRRHPDALVAPGDETAGRWGFTLVRRVRPTEADKRRSSMYVYLAPAGAVPSFAADSIQVLPKDRPQKPAVSYAEPLEHGTVIKLYNYRWKGRSLATRDARAEFEKYLHAPCLPFRVTETRGWFRAHFFSTTVSGIWASITADEAKEGEERKQVEPGFPAGATLALPSTGRLPYHIVVFKADRTNKNTPRGVYFTVNGQVHGQAPADFVSRRLQFEYLKDDLFVSVDCTAMNEGVREDFFMASRDRLRKNEVYDELLTTLQSDLKGHPGLKQMNAARRAKRVEEGLGKQEDVVRTFEQLLKADPGLRSLFELGDRLVTTVGPADVEKFEGRRFPTFFKIVKEPKGGLLKKCPLNRTCRVEFATDAENGYFDRQQSPGKAVITPEGIVEHTRLWNGLYSVRFRLPDGSKPGDRVQVTVAVTDPDRESRGKPPFWCEFEIKVGFPVLDTSPPGKPERPKQPNGRGKEAPRLAVPNIFEVHRDGWAEHGFTEYDALRVQRDGQGGYDLYVNLDNAYLVNEVVRLPSEADQNLARYWFKWGLAFCAMGMMRHLERVRPGLNSASPNGGGQNGEMGGDPLDLVNETTGGVASVIVPVIRSLNRAPEAS